MSYFILDFSPTPKYYVFEEVIVVNHIIEFLTSIYMYWILWVIELAGFILALIFNSKDNPKIVQYCILFTMFIFFIAAFIATLI